MAKKEVHKIYKIRDKKTGLFSRGGSYGHGVWSKTGKSWGNIGHIKNHLNQYIDRGAKARDYPYEDAEIIEIELDYDKCYKEEVETLFNKQIENKKEAEDEYKKRVALWKEAEEKKLLASLKAKYE